MPLICLVSQEDLLQKRQSENDYGDITVKVAYWTNSLSPHQFPLAKAIAEQVGEENYRYVYRDAMSQERKDIGWKGIEIPLWCMRGSEDSRELIEADLVYTGGLRPLELIEKRIALGKRTYYVTERWFKPINVMGVNLPGKLRLVVPSYRRMARRMVEMLNNPLCKCLAIGPWAKKDMQSLGVRPEQIWDCGYYVEESGKWKVESGKLGAESVDRTLVNGESPIRVLWVGRLLKLKRVDTIIRAVGECAKMRQSGSLPKMILDIYGIGPEEGRLKKLAVKYGDVIQFHPPVSIDAVRKLMREHDVYIFASDSNEGWGAVVSEALEEGMSVIGTYEAGASVAMLPKERLFHSGDYKALALLLEKECKGELPPCSIGDWTAEKAAKRLIENVR